MLSKKKIIQIANAVQTPISRGIYAYLSAFANDIQKELSQNGPEAKLLEVEKAVKKYYAALDRREHGGRAQDKAFNEIQQALGMQWQPEEMLKESEHEK